MGYKPKQMNGKKAKKLKKEAIALSVGQPQMILDKLYKRMKKVHTSLKGKYE